MLSKGFRKCSAAKTGVKYFKKVSGYLLGSNVMVIDCFILIQSYEKQCQETVVVARVVRQLHGAVRLSEGP